MKPGLRSFPHEQGIALVVSLLVVAIVASLALLFSARQQLWLRQIENRNNFSMAQGVAIAAIDMSRLTLRDDARNNQVDHLLEPWTIPIPPIAVEEGRIAGRLSEQQGRFNLSNLLPANNAEPKADDPALLRASRALGVGANDLVGLLREFRNLRQREPYSTPELGELLRLAALPASSAQNLTRQLNVLPEKTPLNVNFASAEALQASIEGLGSGDAAALVAQRAGKPFLSLDEFRRALPESLRSKADSQTLAVQSRYFLVDIDAWFNDMHMGFQAQLRRDGNRLPILLWMRRHNLSQS